MAKRRAELIWIAALLVLSVLACRPVITVGYSEVLIVFVIGVILLGPLVFRIYRFMARFQNAAPPEKDKQSKPKARKRRKATGGD